MSQSQAAQQVKNIQHHEHFQLVRAALNSWKQGFYSSLTYSSAVKYFYQVPKLQKLTWENAKPNIILALSAIIYECYLDPFIKNFESSWDGPQISNIVSYIFYFAWGLPVYGYSFYMNMKWVGEISQLAYEASDGDYVKVNQDKSDQTNQTTDPVQQSPQTPKAQQQPKTVVLAFKYNDKIQVTEDIVKYVILGLFFIQIKLIQQVWGLGFFLGFIMYTWFNAVFIYECKWALEKKHLDYRISLVEKTWAYFSGFGFLMSCAQLLPPFLIGASLQLALFPFYILVAMDTNQQLIVNSVKYTSQGQTKILPQLPLFYFSTAPALFIVKRYFKNIDSKIEKKTQ